MTKISDERTKLLASALDRASTACFTVGIVTPLAGYIYDVSGFRSAVSPAIFLLGMVGWLVAAIVLHLGARIVLGRLTP